MIGKHQPHDAVGLDSKALVRAMLDESMTALAESIQGLSDEQFWSFPLEGRHNIVCLFEHCLQCLDCYAVESQGWDLTFRPEEKFDIWQNTPQQLRPKMNDLPTAGQCLERLEAIGNSVMKDLEALPPESLAETCPGWFGEETGKNRMDAYWRVVAHTQTHVRQIWLKRGALGLGDGSGWPQQHWA